MAEIDYGNGPKQVVASVYTMMLYEQAFHSDIVSDVWGRVELTRDDIDGASQTTRRNSAGDEVVLTIDFTRTNWTALTKALWACEKTADESVPIYEKWAEDVGEVDLMQLKNELLPVLNAGFFLAGAADSE